ncbi:MAG: hypothetical protein ACXABG_00290, partial [Promethearchaeota archaeon]
LADDEELLKEIKFCLEAIGRRLRVYLNRKANIQRREKRSGLIERYIPMFVQSAYNIASQGNGKYKGKISEKELEKLMKDAIGAKVSKKVIESKIEPTVKEEAEKEKYKKVEVKWEETGETTAPLPEVIESNQINLTEKTLRNWTINELREYCEENNIKLPSKARKGEIIYIVQEFYKKGKPVEIVPPIKEEKKPLKIEPVKPGTIAEKRKQLQIAKGEEKPRPIEKKEKIVKPQPQLTQTHLPIITTEKITEALSDEWQPITSLIFKMKIKDMMDARFLQIKLKELERKGLVLAESKTGKKHWKLK